MSNFAHSLFRIHLFGVYTKFYNGQTDKKPILRGRMQLRKLEHNGNKFISVYIKMFYLFYNNVVWK